MQKWLVPVKTLLIWLLVVVGVAIICHLATTANAQQMPEMIEPVRCPHFLIQGL